MWAGVACLVCSLRITEVAEPVSVYCELRLLVRDFLKCWGAYRRILQVCDFLSFRMSLLLEWLDSLLLIKCRQVSPLAVVMKF